MVTINSGSTDRLVEPGDPIAAWATRAWQAACNHFDDERMAGAAALLRAAGRVILTGSGIGLDAARYGRLALSEAGFDARAIQSAELAHGALELQPSDVVLGIDTSDDYLPSALARARALGLRTLGLTDQDLTLIGTDVLVQYAEPDGGRQNAGRSPVPICAYLSLLVAKVEPSAPLAFEAANFASQFRRLAEERATTVGIASGLASDAGRLVLCTAASTGWVGASIARRINHLETGLPAVEVHLADLLAGWRPRHDDRLIILAPVEWGDELSLDPSHLPEHIWYIGGPATGIAAHTRLRSQSPALASLSANFVLELFLDEFPPR